MRNGNAFDDIQDAKYKVRFYLTYEEWKQASWIMAESKWVFVFTLPMRNGNTDKQVKEALGELSFYLTYEEWKLESTIKC